MSLKQIAEGWGNLLSENERINKIADMRKRICDACPVSEMGKSRWCKKTNGGCGCFLPAKRASMSSECPKKKWLAEPENNE